MMGGALGRGNITPAAEFNVFFDAHAFDEVLRLKGPIPLYMIPLEVTHQNLATQRVFDHCRSNQDIPFVCAVHTMLTQFQTMYSTHYKLPFPPIHDPLTIFYLLHPQEIDMVRTRIEVDTGAKSYGRTNCFFQGPTNPHIESESVDFVATNLRNEEVRFWDEMLKILD
jgi:inosine-uridine nucleoside N-ribohydrolase